MTKKILYSALYADDCYPFESLAQKVEVARVEDDLKELDSMLVVWGGADIDPSYYNHPKHRTTHSFGDRDRKEWSLMTAAKEKGIPILGICRGAQMLTALSGGWLFQDVQNHAGAPHLVATIDNKVFPVNSLHHQMMGGLDMVDHQLIGWSVGRLSDSYGYKNDMEYVVAADFKEPEFVYFPKTRGYAVQWHPEMMRRDCIATEYVLNFIKEKELAHGDRSAYAYLELTV